jgi:hypothetical protein
MTDEQSVSWYSQFGEFRPVKEARKLGLQSALFLTCDSYLE